jgi:hypothetical protein
LDRRPLPLFHPQATAFDPNNAWWLAELSRLVYRHDIEESPFLPQPRRTEFLAQVGLRQVAFFNAKREGTQGFLVESFEGPPFAALVFRGTENIRDWLTNIDVSLDTSHDIPGLVHKGFLRALDAVWPDVASALADITVPIFYAGHSMGAALATLAAARKPPQALYAFGSPRIGDDVFAQAFTTIPAYRLVHNDDPVVDHPSGGVRYTHIGELHALHSFAALPPVERQAWFSTVRSVPAPLANHAPIHYSRCLAAMESSSG